MEQTGPQLFGFSDAAKGGVPERLARMSARLQKISDINDDPACKALKQATDSLYDNIMGLSQRATAAPAA